MYGHMFLIVKPDCEEEQPDLLWDPQRAKREGARADRKGSRSCEIGEDENVCY